MKWYTQNIPTLGESVMCTVLNYVEGTGFNVTLDEYDGYEALLMLRDLHSKKIKKNVASFLKVGEQLPLTVTNIDDERVYVSKKDIKEGEIAICKTYFSQTSKLFSLAKRLSHVSSFTELQWHEQFTILIMDYLDKCSDKGEDMDTHPYAMCIDKSTLNTLPLSPPYMEVLELKHIDLFGIQICTIKKYFNIQSYQIDGNERVKTILLSALALYKNDKTYTNQELHDDQTLCNVTLLPIAVPKFELHVQCYLPKYGVTVAQKILSSIAGSGLDYYKELTETPKQ